MFEKGDRNAIQFIYIYIHIIFDNLWIFVLIWALKAYKNHKSHANVWGLHLAQRDAQLPRWLTRCHRSRRMFGSPAGDVSGGGSGGSCGNQAWLDGGLMVV